MTTHGRCTRPALATLSTWDPFLKESADFVKVFATYAHRRDMAAAALLVDPTPAAVVKGESTWPYFQDVATRVELLHACGVDAVGVISFAEDDLAAGAQEFFELVTREWELAEFWLRNRQSLGSGAKGSATAVRSQCAEHGWKLRYVKRFIPDVGVVTRASLAAGSVKRATVIARTLPTFRRPASGVVRLAWQPGEYQAVAATEPDLSMPNGEQISIMIRGTDDGVGRLEWPDPSIEYLRFTAGPADLALDHSAAFAAPQTVLA
ncbi:MAG: hypothetical protein ABIT20_17080 [Gemmatimonadaceae bacterium]